MGSITRIDRPKPWRARYYSPDGRQISKTFRRKIDAEKWLRREESKVERANFAHSLYIREDYQIVEQGPNSDSMLKQLQPNT